MASKHFPGFHEAIFSYRGSLRRHDLCICNLIVLIANTKIRQFDWDAISGVKYHSSLASNLPGRDVKSLYYQAMCLHA